ncbi:hypothetical protein Sjap_013044 [Stephania japonica]|uniref:LOB domain-containing protein n=1 Tax=Stephania japonica TaxID=461633 RepID=A0AAP0NXB8_9MAGN
MDKNDEASDKTSSSSSLHKRRSGKRAGPHPLQQDATEGGTPARAPCGVCKFLRRKCMSGCIFVPHFGSEQGAARFAAVHKVRGKQCVKAAAALAGKPTARRGARNLRRPLLGKERRVCDQGRGVEEEGVGVRVECVGEGDGMVFEASRCVRGSLGGDGLGGDGLGGSVEGFVVALWEACKTASPAARCNRGRDSSRSTLWSMQVLEEEVHEWVHIRTSFRVRARRSKVCCSAQGVRGKQVSKLLLHLPANQRHYAVVTISYEAQARLSDPVYGCVSTILALQQQLGIRGGPLLGKERRVCDQGRGVEEVGVGVRVEGVGEGDGMVFEASRCIRGSLGSDGLGGSVEGFARLKMFVERSGGDRRERIGCVRLKRGCCWLSSSFEVLRDDATIFIMFGFRVVHRTRYFLKRRLVSQLGKYKSSGLSENI